MKSQELTLKSLLKELEELKKKDSIKVGDDYSLYLDKIRDIKSIKDIETFWPPRLIDAYKTGNLMCFFGAGLSIPSGMPSWTGLLNRFSIDKRFMEDQVLQNDPLTLAELAYHQLGSEQLQNLLRSSVEGYLPSISHLLVAALRLPFYITTNYDKLFEDAWELINDDLELVTLLDNDDIYREFPNGFKFEENPKKRYLIKIHGCVKHKDQLLILTRSAYRNHYRLNEHYFNFIEKILSYYHTLFLGFSHRDPEITRLVEDVIFDFENTEKKENPPNFYSLQFEMNSFTPEIFAARGIVALKPPISFTDNKSVLLGKSIIDLIGSRQLIETVDSTLYLMLDWFKKKISAELSNALNIIDNSLDNLYDKHQNKQNFKDDMKSLYVTLGELANQGVYYTNSEGIVVECYESENLEGKVVPGKTNFGMRPYFKQAKTFRKSFISNSASSVYNQQSTFFICVPVIKDSLFKGLLFAACQIGGWKLPLEQAEKIWNTKFSLLLIDSNGVCLMPPNREIELSSNPKSPGYFYNDLLAISRRDKLIAKVMANIIPLHQDDDVFDISPDLSYFSVITNLEPTNWKLGISKPLFK